MYPRFSELANEHGPVLKYEPFGAAEEFTVKHLSLRAVDVNHKVPSSGFLISDTQTTIALSGDTAGTEGFWKLVNAAESATGDVFVVDGRTGLGFVTVDPIETVLEHAFNVAV